MSIEVRIPTPLRRLTDGNSKVESDGSTLIEVVNSLNSQFPGIKDRLCDDNNELRNFVNIYINGEDVRFLDGIHSSVKDGDELSIVPAVAGGN